MLLMLRSATPIPTASAEAQVIVCGVWKLWLVGSNRAALITVGALPLCGVSERGARPLTAAIEVSLQVSSTLRSSGVLPGTKAISRLSMIALSAAM